MSLAALVKPQETELGYGPMYYEYAGTWEIMGKAFDNHVANYNLSSETYNYHAERGERDKSLAEILGDDFYGVANAGIDRMSDIATQERTKQQNLDNYILENGIDLPTDNQLKEAGMERARVGKAEFESALQRAAPGAWTGIASFAGGVGATFQDPTNLASMMFPMGLPGHAAKVGLGRLMLQEAVVNAAVETFSQPQVMEWQREVGHEYGLDEAVMNVAFAGLAGAAFPAVVKMGATGLYKAATFKGFSPDQVEWLNFMSKKEVTEQMPATVTKSDKTMTYHYANLDRTQRVIANERRLPTRDDLDPRSTEARFHHNDNVTHDHLDVVNRASDAGIEPGGTGWKKFVRKVFIDEVKAETTRKANLVGEIKIDELEMRMAELNSRLSKQSESYAKSRQLSNRPGMKPKKAAKHKADADKAMEQVRKTAGEVQATKQSLDVHREAAGARKDLEKLANGVMPIRQQARYKWYKNMMDEVTQEIETGEAPVIYPDIMRNPVRSIEPAKAKADLKELQAPEVDAAIEKELKRMAEMNPDMKINGERIGDIMDDIKAAKKEANIIRSCFT